MASTQWWVANPFFVCSDVVAIATHPNNWGFLFILNKPQLLLPAMQNSLPVFCKHFPGKVKLSVLNKAFFFLKLAKSVFLFRQVTFDFKKTLCYTRKYWDILFLESNRHWISDSNINACELKHLIMMYWPIFVVKKQKHTCLSVNVKKCTESRTFYTR